MSHVTKLRMVVKDLDSLAEAAEVLGMELHRDQKAYTVYYGRKAPCQHALALKVAKPGAFEIGLLQAKAGDPEAGYELHSDNMAYDILAAAGPDSNRLKQEYAVATATRKVHATLARKGYKVSREALAGGRVRLRVRGR